MSFGQRPKHTSLLFSSSTKGSAPYIISTAMSHKNHHHLQPPSYATDPNTMFVEADPSNFRNIVQRLTGAPPELSAASTAQHKLPLSPKKAAFKLHERRQSSSKKMELKINNDSCGRFNRGFHVSPVSHLDPYWTGVSPQSARENHMQEKEEQKAIAEKGFYFLPSPRSSAEPAPQLLPLFPLPSPNGGTSQRD